MNTYISREGPVLEGDDAKILTQEELGQGQEDHCWFNHRSTCTTSVFPKNTERDVLFLDQDIWREEHKSEYDFEKTIENAETIQSYFTRVSQIKEQLEELDEEVENANIMITTLSRLPGSWDSFMWGMCARRKWLLSIDSRKKTPRRRRSLNHKKRREDGSNWRSLKQWGIWRTQLLKNFLSTSAFDKKWCDYEWRRRWRWRLKKESTLETNKDKYSIVISLYYFFMHLFIFSYCIMHDRMFALMTEYY